MKMFKNLLSILIFFALFSVNTAHAQTTAQFTAEYFNNTSLSGLPTFTRNETAIDYNWGAGSPHPSIPVDNFSTRWSTTITIDTEAQYRFQTYSDDGVRLIIDGETVINRWIDQGPTQYSATRTLSAGQHSIVLEYYERSGGAVAQLQWSVDNEASKIRVMPLGDSITHGWNVEGGYRIRLLELMPDLNFVGSQQNGPGYLSDKDHQGHPGWVVQEIANNVNGWLNAQQPQIILLKIGTNDVGQANWATTPDRLSALIDQITTQQPNTELLVANLIPRTDGSSLPKVQQINSAIPGIIQQKRDQGKKVHFVDMYSVVGISDLADGIHPNLNGYNKMGVKWAESIALVQDGITPPIPSTTPSPTPTPTPNPEYPEESEAYFIGEYFSNMSLSGQPTLVRTDEFVNFNWGAGSPHASIGNDNFSARWSKPQTFLAGTYQFSVTGDDGVRLRIDGETVINQWKDQGPTTYTADIQLTADQHDIVFEYYEKGGGATAQLSWILLEEDDDTEPTPTPTPTTTPPVEPGEGYTGSYFTNTTLAGIPTFSRNDAEINFDWAAGSPHASIPVDNFSARWTQTVTLEAGEYRFTATGDDGLRVFVDGVAVINQWKDQGPTTYTVDRTLTEGTHQIVVEYYEKGGGALMQFDFEKIAEIEPEPEPTEAPEPTPTPLPEEPGDGFTGEYFTNTTLAGVPALTREDAEIDFNWSAGSPHASIPVDNFSARWTKNHSFSAGNYRFSLTGDDGIRLKVDGQTVIDQWKDQGPTTYTADLVLTAGVHQIVVEYYEKGGGATAQLNWQVLGNSTPTPTPTPIPENPPSSELPVTGFNAEYFNNVSLTGSPIFTQLEDSINFNWILGSPHESVNVDNFSARWSSNPVFENGTYRFTMTGDDGVRLFVDGQIVINRWVDQGPTTYTVDLPLTAGNHSVVMEYYEKTLGAVARLSWQKLN